MGIPKFYRWLSERYPLLNMSVTATEAPPDIDNLYLDMNGIIHNCTHANDPNLKLTENEMIVRIFTYLDKLIQIIKPQQLVFMAIDGVAPRAKMNQQRARRFKSAQERIAREKEMEAKGEAIAPEHAFDSNCITPGTPFMERLGKHLRFFLRHKISSDPTWQKPTVIFSGHEVPGEGEHKIMEYIRWQKRSPGYTPNQRHCMYGLDADLIMLSLVTHEPHFCLLREVVSFSGKGRGQPSRETLENPCAENFILFQIGLLREYFDTEFRATVHVPWGELDLERIVDDFVLFCMLVGNDFLPALPTLDIAEGALNKLIDTYKRLLPSLGGYLTYAGQLNHARLEQLLGKVAEMELETLEERAADTEWFENKRSKRPAGDGMSHVNTPSSSRPGSNPRGRATSRSASGNALAAAAAGGAGGVLGLGMPSEFSVLATIGDGDEDAADPGPKPLDAVSALEEAELALISPLAPDDLVALEPEEAAAAASGPTMMSKEARDLFLNGGGAGALAAWKERWYKVKMGYPDAGPSSTRQVVGAYLTGLHWVLQYYYRGVASWDWFYPHHYAPMASDLIHLETYTVSFEQGRPFTPYQQLLAVLPCASASHLPLPCQRLMCEPHSPIKDFYPEKFDMDMEGKRADWEAIVLIPFINEARLLAAEEEWVKPEMLSEGEHARNKLGDMLVFRHSPGAHDPSYCTSTMASHFADVTTCHSSVTHVPPPQPLPEGELGFKPELVSGTKVGTHNPPGFPTLKTMKGLKVELKMAGVTVFGNPSKKDSCVLVMPDIQASVPGGVSAATVAGMLMERVFIKWPYLQEAQIMSVSDANSAVTPGGVQPHDREEAGQWQALVGRTKNLFLTKMGLEVGSVPVLLQLRACTGFSRNLDGVVSKSWAKELVPYPLQAVLRERPRPPEGFRDPGEPKVLCLSPGEKAVYMGTPYWGAVASVLPDPGRGLGADGSRLPAAKKSYRVSLQVPSKALEAAGRRTKQIVAEHATLYTHASTIANELRMSPRVLGRITGSLWLGEGGDRTDIGLCVKNAKEGLCVPGYSQPTADNQGWQYSRELKALVASYRSSFPWLFTALDRQRDGHKLTIEGVLPNDEPAEQQAKLAELKAWLKALPCAKRPLVKTSVRIASDAAMQHLLLANPAAAVPRASAYDTVELEQVEERLLLPPFDPHLPLSAAAGGDMELGDRVMSLRSAGTPVFGERGTVVGVYEHAVELVMDAEFVGGTTLGGRLLQPRGASIPTAQVLNLTRANPQRVPSGGGAAAAGAHKSKAGAASSSGAGHKKGHEASAAAEAALAALGGGRSRSGEQAAAPAVRGRGTPQAAGGAAGAGAAAAGASRLLSKLQNKGSSGRQEAGGSGGEALLRQLQHPQQPHQQAYNGYDNHHHQQQPAPYAAHGNRHQQQEGPGGNKLLQMLQRGGGGGGRGGGGGGRQQAPYYYGSDQQGGYGQQQQYGGPPGLPQDLYPEPQRPFQHQQPHWQQPQQPAYPPPQQQQQPPPRGRRGGESPWDTPDWMGSGQQGVVVRDEMGQWVMQDPATAAAPPAAPSSSTGYGQYGQEGDAGYGWQQQQQQRGGHGGGGGGGGGYQQPPPYHQQQQGGRGGRGRLPEWMDDSPAPPPQGRLAPRQPEWAPPGVPPGVGGPGGRGGGGRGGRRGDQWDPVEAAAVGRQAPPPDYVLRQQAPPPDYALHHQAPTGGRHSQPAPAQQGPAAAGGRGGRKGAAVQGAAAHGAPAAVGRQAPPPDYVHAGGGAGPSVQQPGMVRPHKVRRNSIGQFVLVEDEPLTQPPPPAAAAGTAAAAPKGKKAGKAAVAGAAVAAAAAAAAAASVAADKASSSKAGKKAAAAGAAEAGAAPKTRKEKEREKKEKAKAAAAAAAGPRSGVQEPAVKLGLTVGPDGRIAVALAPAASGSPTASKAKDKAAGKDKEAAAASSSKRASKAERAAAKAAFAARAAEALSVQLQCTEDGLVKLHLKPLSVPAAGAGSSKGGGGEGASTPTRKRTAAAAKMPENALQASSGLVTLAAVDVIKKPHTEGRSSAGGAASAAVPAEGAGVVDVALGVSPAGRVSLTLTPSGELPADAGAAGSTSSGAATSAPTVAGDAPPALEKQVSLTLKVGPGGEVSADVAPQAPAAQSPPAAGSSLPASSPTPVSVPPAPAGVSPKVSPRHPAGDTSRNSSAGGAKGVQPRLPDGSRGFSWGRGKRMSAPDEPAAPGSTEAVAGSSSAPVTPSAAVGQALEELTQLDAASPQPVTSHPVTAGGAEGASGATAAAAGSSSGEGIAPAAPAADKPADKPAEKKRGGFLQLLKQATSGKRRSE